MTANLIIIAVVAFVGLSLLPRSIWCGLANTAIAFLFWGAVWITYLAFRA